MIMAPDALCLVLFTPEHNTPRYDRLGDGARALTRYARIVDLMNAAG